MAASPFYFTCSLITAFVIIVLNSYVISLFKRKRNLRSHSNYLLLSLTISDLFTGVFVIPYTVAVGMLNHLPAKYRGFFIFNDIIVVFSASITMLNLSAIIMDRYLLLCHPLSYSNVQSKARFLKFIALMWLTSILCSCIPLVWLTSVMTHSVDAEIILNAKKKDRVYSIVGFGLYCLVCLAIFFAFVRMFWSIRKFKINQRNFFTSRKERNSLKSEWKAFILFSMMFGIFLLCWSPMVIIRFFLEVLNPFQPTRYFLESLVLIRFLSSLCNPVLYTFYKLDFRTAVKEDKRHMTSFVSAVYNSRNLKFKQATSLNVKDCNQSGDHSFPEKTNTVHHIDGHSTPTYYTPYKAVSELKVVSFADKSRSCTNEPVSNKTSRPLTSTPEIPSDQAKKARMMFHHDPQLTGSPVHRQTYDGEDDIDSLELSMIYVPPKGLTEDTIPFCSSYDLMNEEKRSGGMSNGAASIRRSFSLYDNIDCTDMESIYDDQNTSSDTKLTK